MTDKKEDKAVGWFYTTHACACIFYYNCELVKMFFINAFFLSYITL